MNTHALLTGAGCPHVALCADSFWQGVPWRMRWMGNAEQHVLPERGWPTPIVDRDVVATCIIAHCDDMQVVVRGRPGLPGSVMWEPWSAQRVREIGCLYVFGCRSSSILSDAQWKRTVGGFVTYRYDVRFYCVTVELRQLSIRILGLLGRAWGQGHTSAAKLREQLRTVYRAAIKEHLEIYRQAIAKGRPTETHRVYAIWLELQYEGLEEK